MRTHHRLKGRAPARLLVGCLLVLLMAAAPGAAQSERLRTLTVADAVNTTRFMLDGAREPAPVSLSPDGARYALRLIQGDAGSDSVLLRVMSGELKSAGPPKLVTTLRTRGYSYPPRFHYPLLSEVNPIKWLDDRTIAFLWEDENVVLQVVSLQLDTGALSYLTRSPTDVVLFHMTEHAIAYVAFEPTATPPSDTHDGYVVEAPDAFSLLSGSNAAGLLDARYNFSAWVGATAAGAPQRVTADIRWGGTLAPIVSPDGRTAIFNTYPRTLSEAWRAYPTKERSLLLHIVHSAFEDQRSWYGRQLTQLQVVDTTTGAARPLWDAPTLNPYDLQVSWSPDGRRVLVGPTLLPLDGAHGAAASTGTAFADIDVATGRYRVVPFTPPESGAASPYIGHGVAKSARWVSDQTLEIESTSVQGFKLVGDAWRRDDASAPPPAETTSLTFEVRQSLNETPKLFSIDAQRRAKLLLDPNLALRGFTLGRVEAVSWTTPDGQAWKGVLYYPVHFRAGRRYPMVIQTHGVSTSQFSLYGLGNAPGAGPGWSIYAAQPLANRDILVLQIEDKRPNDQSTEAALHMAAYDAAISHFDRLGILDANRVGLSGFSRTGWHVEYAVTHSERVYAAALTSDNISGGYFEATLVPGTFALENGAEPIGKDLARWLESAPSFSVERIRTPLRLQVESEPGATLLTRWELFSRMRKLQLPVEYYVIPEVRRGSHNIQNPRQILASQQGAVDWFDFWLNGRERSDADPTQYVRWRELRRLRDAAATSPRPPLLRWEARPAGNANAVTPN